MSNLREIINEEYSISDEVMKISKEITMKLLELFNNTTPNGFNEKYVEYHLERPIFGIINNFICVSRDITKCDEGAKFKGDTIFIEVPTQNGEMFIESLYKDVSHELEHVFQVYMTKQNGSIYRTSNLYYIAISFLKDSNPIIQTVAKLIYGLNTKESDAFCHEYYTEYLVYLKNGIPLDDKNTFVDAKLINLYKLYEKFKSYDRAKINALLIKTFKKNYSDLDYFFKHGFKYLEKKLKNVEKKVTKYLQIDENIRHICEEKSKLILKI